MVAPCQLRKNHQSVVARGVLTICPVASATQLRVAFGLKIRARIFYVAKIVSATLILAETIAGTPEGRAVSPRTHRAWCVKKLELILAVCPIAELKGSRQYAMTDW